MISLYSGTPGSGKSLHLAKDILEAYAGNRPIVTNFLLNADNLGKGFLFKKINTCHYKYVNNQDLTAKVLVDYSKWVFERIKYKEGRILLVIDECQLLFNSREWQKSGRNDWLTFFTQHRKLGYEIILVAQFDRMIDRQIRSLIELEYMHRKVENFGNFGKFFPLAKIMFCVVQYYYPIHERLGASFFMLNKRFYSIYDTNYMFECKIDN